MKLHEYQVKQLLLQHNLPVPIGYVCRTIKEIEYATTKLGNIPWVVKCQIHAGGRGKAGGIRVVDNLTEVKAFVKKWLRKRLVTEQTDIQGQPVNQILIEVAVNINKELYLGATVDFISNKIIFLASTLGGIEVEKLVNQYPELIYKVIIDPLIGPMPYQGRELAFKLGLAGKQIEQFSKIFTGLAIIFLKFDLLLIEINPLVITDKGDLICLDSKVRIDNNALYRQLELQKMRDISQENPHEVYASKWKLNYISLGGNIGCIVNGAGLAMGTMDVIRLYGGNPANFLDVGGTVTKKIIKKAFKIILSDKNVTAILVNIFGGIVHCDLIADSIIAVVGNSSGKIPIVVRFEGNRAELAMQKLINNYSNIKVTSNLIDAIKMVIAIVKKK